MTVLAYDNWATNGHLIADVAALGYLDNGMVTLDPTYGRGRFWSKFRPAVLVTSDLYVQGPEIQHQWDYTKIPRDNDLYDAVVFDPPYKLNGTPALGDFDDAYGVNVPTTWQERHESIMQGIEECLRVLKPGGTFLLKCQDQVCSGKVRWQTRLFADHAERCQIELVDRFDLVGKSRPQPMEGRTQRTAHGRPSTLLVFK